MTGNVELCIDKITIFNAKLIC